MSDTYQKASGSAGSKGVDFQIDLLSVFLLNALQSNTDWKLSTENKLAGKFDDVVLELCDGSAILLQAKHKTNKRVTLNQLLSTNSKNEDFSLPKYFFSYLEVKTNFPVKLIIICTNTQADIKISRCLIQNSVYNSSMLYYKEGASFYTFRDDLLTDLIANAKVYYKKNLVGKGVEETVINEENAKDFLNHLQLYLDYPAEEELEKITEQLLSGLKFAGNLPSHTSYRELHQKVKDWFEQPKGEYLTKLRIEAMFCEIRVSRYFKTLEDYKVFFRRNDFDITNSNKRIFHVVTQGEYLLHLIKVYRCLQRSKIKTMYAIADDGEDVQEQIIKAFELSVYHYLVIVWPKFTKETIISEICTRLRDILNNRKYKKIIFVAERENKLTELMKTIVSDFDEFEESLTLEDLTDETQEKFLKKKSIVFQGEDVSLEELFPKQITQEHKKSLKQEILEKLLIGGKITVGTRLAGLEEQFSKYYINRRFEKRPREAWGENETSTKRKRTIFEEDIYNVDEKMVLISDSAGTGKTTVLTNLAISIKKNNPRLWVVRIELNDCTKILGDLRTNRKFLSVRDLMNCKETTKLTNELEIIIYSLEGKVVLMFDGVDEISPDYTELILDLLVQSQLARNVAKVFVTTRPDTTPLLKRHLSAVLFALVPLTKQNQIDFLASYWTHNLQLESESNNRCEQYARSLINEFPFSSTNWHNKEESQFVVIPLHVKMIAEIFLENKGSKDWEGCKEYLSAGEVKPKLPERMNIVELYEMFIEKKRGIFIVKGNPNGNTTANQALMDQFEECLDYHRYLALLTILDERQSALFPCYQRDVADKEMVMLKMGIVQKLNNQLCFIHRTFAEYFLAEILFRELQLRNKHVKFQQFLIDNIFVYSKFNIVRYFINSFLQELVPSLPCDILKSYKSNVDFKFCRPRSFISKSFSRLFNFSPKETRSQQCDTALHKLAFEGNTEIIRLLLKSVSFQNAARSRIYSRLCFAKTNTLNILQDLLGRDGVNIKNFDQETPLHQAMIGGHLDTVKFLTEIGADMNTKTPGGSTTLLVAADKSRWNIVEFFLKRGGDFTITGPQGRTVLHFAARSSRCGIVEFLLEQGMDIDIPDEHGRTSLHFAAQRGSTDILYLLLARGANINIPDNKGRTALHLAVLIGRRNIVEVLLKQDVDANIADQEERTALHFAVECDNCGIVELLLRHGVGFDIPDIEGRTALHLAALRGRQNIVELLVDYGVDTKIADKQERTVLHLAALMGTSSIVKLLVSHGVDVNIRDKQGRTALHAAAEASRCDIVECLVENGVDLNVADKEGRTALHFAAENYECDVVKILVKHGVGINISDAQGRTALQLAVLKYRRTIADFLTNEERRLQHIRALGMLGI